ncbi:ketopantoate reductase family protein [Haloarcula sp. Atlit-7R]|uniref:ketopantoate reductase family protein n=1 Tax=Haloarcula sp. Atlit-7R TaxID=2282125 RepID=UPI000EF15328|nr:2-dehydropantoate 2-reductase [Haloarcula sp. Atlit-7R]RLM89461.1 2-dehydropantoate 2-reductase [Haloarcula sp. Atlit-7R]
MKIAVYGTGGVGGYFGGRLAQAGADVHLIARGDHLDALREDGLRVNSVYGDFSIDVSATDDPADIGSCEYVLFTVKSFDTAAAARELSPLLDDDTAVISLQNGVDNEGKIAAEIGHEHVMGGVAYIFSTIAEPGVIEHTGGPTSFTIGELDGVRSDRAERLLEWCDRADEMDAELSEAIRTDLWKKTAFICAHAGMTAAVRLPLGEIRNQQASWEMYRRIVDEVCSVGRATGIELPERTATEWVEFAADLDAESYSSLHYDMTHGKAMELEALHGAIVRRGRKAEVEVPMNEAVYAVLRPWAQRNELGRE